MKSPLLKNRPSTSQIKLLLITFMLCFLSFSCETIGQKKSKVPFDKSLVILGGELGNSSASCFEDIDKNFEKLSQRGINTLLVPISWNQLEPIEGEYDFSLTKYTLKRAREYDFNLIYLWFGAWKNSMSCYAPSWFKSDYNRFPRAHTKSGKPLEIASAFSENVFKADSTAFINWLRSLVSNKNWTN